MSFRRSSYLQFLLLTALVGCAGNAFLVPRQEGYSFPPNFLWGVSVAAHQVEGGNDKNDWWDWEQPAGHIKGGDKSGDAVAFRRLYEQDAKLAKELGQNAFRLSLEWSRIEPERGKIDDDQVRYYHNVLAALRRNNLRPFVTLMHFTLPRWVARQGGWENQATVADFEHFAAFCAKEFGSAVDDWITVNEPNSYAFKAYDEGSWPPGKRDRLAAIRVMANLMLGHARAARAIRREDVVAAYPGGPPCRIGLAHYVAVFDPWNPLSPIDQARAYFEDQAFNWAPIEATRPGRFSVSLPGMAKVEVSAPDLASSVDFIGINYYRRLLPSGLSGYRQNPKAMRSDLDWEVYPDGLYRWLERVSSRALPIYVTENGIADASDKLRAKFVVSHLMRVWQAIAAGVPVKGYFHWSLMDNFEWAEGYSARFGLYRVDLAKSNGSRELTRGGQVYRDIAKANRLTAEQVLRYGD